MSPNVFISYNIFFPIKIGQESDTSQRMKKKKGIDVKFFGQ